MTHVAADKHPPDKWPQMAFPVQPHPAEPITPIESEALPYPSKGAPLDEWEVLRRSERRFVLELIHPHIEHLRPGDMDSFVVFVGRFGLTEMMLWLEERCEGELPDAWGPVVGAHDALGLRHLWIEHLRQAWTDPRTVGLFASDRRYLLEAKDLAANVDDIDDRREIVSSVAEAVDGFGYETVYDPNSGTRYLRPRHVFARAWHELYAHTGSGLTCPECNNVFIPEHGNQKFCREFCRLESTNRRRSQDPWTRTYDRIRKRHTRGRITDEAFDKWLAENPRPKGRRT
jgi:hypothetical protein